MSVLEDTFSAGEIVEFNGLTWVVDRVYYDPVSDRHFMEAHSVSDPDEHIRFTGENFFELPINISRGETYWVEV